MEAEYSANTGAPGCSRICPAVSATAAFETGVLVCHARVRLAFVVARGHVGGPAACGDLSRDVRPGRDGLCFEGLEPPRSALRRAATASEEAPRPRLLGRDDAADVFLDRQDAERDGASRRVVGLDRAANRESGAVAFADREHLLFGRERQQRSGLGERIRQARTATRVHLSRRSRGLQKESSGRRRGGHGRLGRHRKACPPKENAEGEVTTTGAPSFSFSSTLTIGSCDDDVVLGRQRRPAVVVGEDPLVALVVERRRSRMLPTDPCRARDHCRSRRSRRRAPERARAGHAPSTAAPVASAAGPATRPSSTQASARTRSLKWRIRHVMPRSRPLRRLSAVEGRDRVVAEADPGQ